MSRNTLKLCDSTVFLFWTPSLPRYLDPLWDGACPWPPGEQGVVQVEAGVLKTGADPGVGARNAPWPATENGTNIYQRLKSIVWRSRFLVHLDWYMLSMLGGFMNHELEEAFGISILGTDEGFEDVVILSLDLILIWNRSGWFQSVWLTGERAYWSTRCHCSGVLFLDIIVSE